MLTQINMIWPFFNPQEIGLASLSKFWHILHPGIIEHRIVLFEVQRSYEE